jgi:FixJ family two-component response regulator
MCAARGYRTVAFASAEAYLLYRRPEVPACLLIDIRLPDACGLELQQRIASTTHPAVVFVTARGDVASSVQAMKAGAVDYLTEPLACNRVLEAVAEAIARDGRRRAERLPLALLQQRYACLTSREQQVLLLVVSGLLNKQAAADLGISEITLKSHRGKMMKKMAADSLPALVRMASRLDLPLPDTQRHRGAVAPARTELTVAVCPPPSRCGHSAPAP